MISSNIRYDNPGDNLNIWKNRRPILCEIINDFFPDILGTQEGLKTQIKDLECNIKNLQVVDQHRSWIEKRMYPCIFINPQTITIHQSGDVWLSETPHIPGSKSFESTFPRLCTWIKAQHINTSQPFFFVNVHLDHVFESTRKKQINVLIEEISKMNQYDIPIIICGDFNDTPFGPVRAMINKSMPTLYDPWIKLGKDEESSHHSFSETSISGSRIDWIMIDRRINCLDIFLEKKSSEGIYPSDHYPLLCEVEL